MVSVQEGVGCSLEYDQEQIVYQDVQTFLIIRDTFQIARPG